MLYFYAVAIDVFISAVLRTGFNSQHGLVSLAERSSDLRVVGASMRRTNDTPGLETRGLMKTFGAATAAHDIASLTRRKVTGAGICRSFPIPQPCGELTVLENVLVPLAIADPKPPSFFRKALLLSGGQQKLAALGRALMAGSRLLLPDEPFEGVAPALANRLSEVIGTLRASQRSILIAQSEPSHSHAVAEREYVIERGASMS